MFKEDVATHLPSEFRTLLFHLVLDNGMARFPHDGVSAGFPYLGEEVPRTFNVPYYGRSRIRFEKIKRIDKKQHVAAHGVSPLIDDTYPVGVPVKCQTYVKAGFHNFFLYVGEVLLNCGIRVMVRKIAVGVHVKLVDLTAKSSEYLRAGNPRGSIAAVGGDLYPRIYVKIPLEKLKVAFNYVSLPFFPFSRSEISFFDRFSYFLYAFAEEGVLADAQFKPVVFGGVVTRGYHHPAVDARSEGGKINHGSRHHSYVYYVHAG